MQQKIIRQSRSVPFLNPTRIRMTPTFYHHDIFNQATNNNYRMRFTPTFASTAFQNVPQTSSKEIFQTKQLVTLKKSNTSVYVNESQRRKQAELNPCCVYYAYVQQPKDQKDKLHDQIKDFGNQTSRLRKMVDLMSNPIFGGCTLQLTTKQYDPRDYMRPYQQRHKNIEMPEERYAKKKEIQQHGVQEPEELHPVNQIKKKHKDINVKNQKKNVKHEANLRRFKSADVKRRK